jgi:hypothetical protein
VVRHFAAQPLEPARQQKVRRSQEEEKKECNVHGVEEEGVELVPNILDEEETDSCEKFRRHGAHLIVGFLPDPARSAHLDVHWLRTLKNE